MRKILILTGILGLIFSCDKVEEPNVAGANAALDYSLYPGTAFDYDNNERPTFSQNTNTDRNILLEDYTGHKCTFCPPAAVEAKNIEANNPGRVFAVGVHAGPNPATGITNFQETDNGDFTHQFYNEISQAYGKEFSTGVGFTGNPRGNASRKSTNVSAPNEFFTNFGTWSTNVNALLNDNDLKVNLQSVANYYASTKGLFLHVEAEVLDNSITDEIGIITYFIEEEFIAPQKNTSGTIIDYKHHNTLRATIDGTPWGRTLGSDFLVEGNKYELDYSYQIPNEYDGPGNCHVLIYAYNKTTYEVYHVIKQEINE